MKFLLSKYPIRCTDRGSISGSKGMCPNWADNTHVLLAEWVRQYVKCEGGSSYTCLEGEIGSSYPCVASETGLYPGVENEMVSSSSSAKSGFVIFICRSKMAGLIIIMHRKIMGFAILMRRMWMRTASKATWARHTYALNAKQAQMYRCIKCEISSSNTKCPSNTKYENTKWTEGTHASNTKWLQINPCVECEMSWRYLL